MNRGLRAIAGIVDRHERLIAIALVATYALVFATLSLVRHWTYHSTAEDLGVFDQVLWNTLHGRFVESTLSLVQCTPHSFFGDHFSPILLFILPLYAIFPHHETLLVIQTAALALGSWPIYLIARRFLPTSGERLLWVFAYVLSAPLGFITLYDFHEVAFAPLPLGFAMYFLATRRTFSLLAALLVGFMVKEEVTLIGVGFGVALLLQRRWRLGGLVLIGSIVAFVVILKVVIPAFAGVAAYQYLKRYTSLGRDEFEIARTLLLNPPRVLAALGAGEVGSKVVFVASLFGPGLGLALRSKWALVPSLLPLGYLLLSDYGGQHTLHNQYGAPLIPLALGASILGMATLRDRLRHAFAIAAIIATLYFGLVFGGLPLTPGLEDAYLRGTPDRAPSGQSMFVREPRYQPFLEALRAIPADARIASRDFVTTQLPERRFSYYLVGLASCDAEYVILDFADPSVNRDLSHHRDQVKEFQARGFEEIASGEGLSLLRLAKWP